MADDTPDILEKPVKELREELSEYEGDLKSLLEAEENGKNRKTAKEAIRSELERRQQIEEQLSPREGDADTSTDETVQEAAIGTLKIVQKGDKPPQMVCEIGEIQVPLNADMLKGGSGSSPMDQLPLLMLNSGGPGIGTPGEGGGPPTGGAAPGTGTGGSSGGGGGGAPSAAEGGDVSGESDTESVETDVEEAAPPSESEEEAGEAAAAQEQRRQQLEHVLRERYDMSEEELAEKDAVELQKLLEREVEKERLLNELEEYYGQEQGEIEDKPLEELKELRDELKEKVSGEEGEPVHDHEEEKGHEVERGLRLIDQLDLPNLKEEFKDELQEPEEEQEEEEESEGFSRFFSFFQSGGETASGRDLDELMEDALNQCQNIDNYDAATTVLAHVLKQYLEIKMNIRRELTYLEVVRALEQGKLQSDYVEDLKNFYKDMHIQAYKGDARVDFNQAFKLAENVLDEHR